MDAPPAPGRYEVTPLPFIPFSGTGGEALNDAGVVAGGVAHADGSVSLAEWHDGRLTDLGVPPGLPAHGFNRPRVFGINNAGVIVGTVHTPAGDLPSRSFICDRGRFTILPLADATSLGGAAIGINDRGVVVGYDHTARNGLTGWLWSAGSYSALRVSGTSTAAFGINANGTVIGNRTLGLLRRLLTGKVRSTGQRGFVLSEGAVRHLNGFVNALNDSGVAAGGSTCGGGQKATIFSDGIATVILHVPSSAVGINSSAAVVGAYQPAGSQRHRLFLWNANSGACDLTPGGFVSAQAAAINDRGDILGFGETTSMESRYFLLTPRPNGVLTPKAIMTAIRTADGPQGMERTSAPADPDTSALARPAGSQIRPAPARSPGRQTSAW
jgi:hypothetical protein